MGTLRIYGDSFGAKEYPSVPVWADYLAEMLGLSVLNMAVGGSSTEYSIKKFFNDYKAEKFQKDDVIIFVPSHAGRLHFNYQNRYPRTASYYLHDVPNTEINDHPWYANNKHHIEWWMTNTDDEYINLTYELAFTAIKDIARVTSQCTFIILPGYDNSYRFPSSNHPKNFLRSECSLYQISCNEIIGGKSWNDWVQYTQVDVRLNHLSNANNLKLVDLLYQGITHNDLSALTYDKFDKEIFNIIQTKDQYLNYVNKGYLTLLDWILPDELSKINLKNS